MKKLVLSLLVLTGAFSVNAQNSDDNKTCHQKYVEVFEKRGAFPVEDGTYDDVIITIRKGSMTECYYGKVSVKDNIVSTHGLYLKFEDDTFEKINKPLKDPEKQIAIKRGMSETIVTEDEELINVLFVKKIKPKKKSYVKAPMPDFDL